MKTLDAVLAEAAGIGAPVPGHQCRVGRKTLKVAFDRLIARQEELVVAAKDSFAVLHSRIQEITADIPRYGALAVYDMARAVGDHFNTRPRDVYLHTGTLHGARALDWKTQGGILEIRDIPSRVRSKLKPYQWEDFLCIYKDELKTCIRPKER